MLRCIVFTIWLNSHAVQDLSKACPQRTFLPPSCTYLLQAGVPPWRLRACTLLRGCMLWATWRTTCRYESAAFVDAV